MSIERRFSIVVERQRYRPVELVFLVTRHVVVVSLSPEKERVCAYVCVREKINRQEEIFISFAALYFPLPFFSDGWLTLKGHSCLLGFYGRRKGQAKRPFQFINELVVCAVTALILHTQDTKRTYTISLVFPL